MTDRPASPLDLAAGATARARIRRMVRTAQCVRPNSPAGSCRASSAAAGQPPRAVGRSCPGSFLAKPSACCAGRAAPHRISVPDRAHPPPAAGLRRLAEPNPLLSSSPPRSAAPRERRGPPFTNRTTTASPSLRSVKGWPKPMNAPARRPDMLQMPIVDAPDRRSRLVPRLATSRDRLAHPLVHRSERDAGATSKPSPDIDARAVVRPLRAPSRLP